jgi:hypothetical protein
MKVYYSTQWLKSENLIIVFPKLSHKAILINHLDQDAILAFFFEKSKPDSPLQAVEKLVNVFNRSFRFY